MSDTFDAGTGDGTPQGEESPNMKRMRELADKGQRTEEVEALLANAAKENAFLRSGIDIDSPLGAMFYKAFDGDVVDVEGLKSQATELGIPMREAVAPAEGVPGTPAPAEATGTEQRQQLAAGAPADTGEQKHPNEIARDIFKSEMESGGTWEDAAGMMIASKAHSVMAGDMRGVIRQGPMDQ